MIISFIYRDFFHIYKFLFILILVTFSLTTNAQSFRLGGITGLNICKLTDNPNKSFNHVAYKFGGRIATDLQRQFRVSLDLLYSKTGNTIGNKAAFSNSVDINLDYIEIPLMFSFMDWMDDPDEELYYKLHFTAGISLGRLVNYNVKNNLEIDISDAHSFNKNKFSLLAGLVYYVNEHVGINIQHEYALSKIDKPISTFNMKSRIWSINIIYMVDNKRR